jgi:hypothetical protein
MPREHFLHEQRLHDADDTESERKWDCEEETSDLLADDNDLADELREENKKNYEELRHLHKLAHLALDKEAEEEEAEECILAKTPNPFKM